MTIWRPWSGRRDRSSSPPGISGPTPTRKTSAADLVTENDEAVEAFLKERLPKLLPGSQFFGEEEAENCDPSRGWVSL